jgi:hypothetical protein
VELRGDLAAFLHLGGPGNISDARAAVPQMENGRSGEVMGSLVAGARNRRSHHSTVAI